MKAVTEILRSRTLWVGLVLMFGFWAVVPWVPIKPQNEFLRIGRTLVAIAVFISLLPGIVKALRTPWPSYSGQLILGIVLSWFGVAGSAGWVLIWASGGQPQWMLDSNINGWFLWLQILGGTLHLTAKHSVEDDIPRPNWIRLGIAVAIGVLVGIGFMASAPDMHSLVGALKPWFAEHPDVPD
ncbi:hypothetical protein [Methylobacterium sp. ARG-1]|uniref:hypothetical protein n=1 Tax=Methylobacterium sp. ARG-1 TaxID=1692501 RepID=UPI000680C1CB|nr:hypothetical protein [Methylobacterium sp. ARG-1]KNY20873.1 hypothetical protein AKJ13_19705 [Methylobacterium sp. ARG-1]